MLAVKIKINESKGNEISIFQIKFGCLSFSVKKTNSKVINEIKGDDKTKPQLIIFPIA